MAEIKTKPTTVKVEDFINAFADTEQKKKDAFELLQFMQKHSGFKAQMWGPSIIGFGLYHYKSDRSKQEGDWPLVGFSPRKAAISLYVYSGAPGQDEMLKNLGKFKMGKGCIYVKKLSDIHLEVVKQLMDSTIKFLKEKYS